MFLGLSMKERYVASVKLIGTAVLLLLLVGCTSRQLPRMPGGDAERGREQLQAYGCGACHTIPGVPGATATVGPPLTNWGERHYIAGSLTNSPENLIEWLRFPQQIEPGTAMPNMDVTEQDARDMGAYLYTLER